MNNNNNNKKKLGYLFIIFLRIIIRYLYFNMAESLKIEVNRLAKSEILYELAVRGVKHPDDASVEDLRKVLRKSLKLDHSCLAGKKPKYPFNFDEDYNALKTVADELDILVENFTCDDVRTGKKISTKIAYALGRLDRADPKEDADKKNKKAEMRFRLLLIYDNFITKTKPDKRNKNTTLLDLNVMNSTAISESLSSESSDSSSENGDDTEVNRRKGKPVPLRDWGLRFTGEKSDKGISFSCFLERVNELRKSRHVSRQMLFEEAGDLFDGEAKKWFNLVRDWVVDWDSLVDAMREEFQGPDYDKRLFEEIKHRTQGENESIGSYVAAMNGLFSRLQQTIPKEVKLKILLDNIAPYYQPHLAFRSITSVVELLSLCRKLDEKRMLANSYVPPPRKSKCLEPDLAYADTSSTASTSRSGDANFQDQPTNPKHFRKQQGNKPSNCAVADRSRSSTFKCWNCNGGGHLSVNCPEPQKRYCYRCGHPDVTLRSCPKCKTQQGNGRAGQ